MHPPIPDNLLEGDVVYLPPERVGAQAHAAPGSPFYWPPDLAIPVLGERMETLRRAGRIDQHDLYCGMLRALLIHPNAETAEAYRNILREWQPDLEAILRAVGVGWANGGQPERGARYLRLAIHVAPDAAEARHDLGVCLNQLALERDAAGDPTEAARLRQEAEKHLAEARQRKPLLEAQTLAEIEREMEAASEALRRGAASEARAGLARVVGRQPQRWPAWFLLGIAHRMQGDFGGAARALEQALALAPEEPEVHNELGLARLLRREYAQAEAHFRKASALRPERAGYLCNLALALLPLGRVEEAEEALDRATQREPGSEILPRCRAEARRFHHPLYRLYRRFAPLRDEGWKRPPAAS